MLRSIAIPQMGDIRKICDALQMSAATAKARISRLYPQQFAQRSKLRQSTRQRLIYQIIMPFLQSLECLPVHPFGFASMAIQDASLPAQPITQLVCHAACPVMGLLALRGIGQSIAVPTSVSLAAVQDRYAPPTSCCRANPPRALPAKVAGGPGHMHRVIHLLPFPAPIPRLIVQRHPVGVNADIDVRYP